MYRVFAFKRALMGILCLLIAALILLGTAVNIMPVGAPQRALPIYSVETEKPLVSLGINCAWDDSDIDRLLELLDRHSVKATFFFVGDWCDRYPDAVKRIAATGHELGSHSDTHPDMTKLSREQIEQQLTRSGDKIETLTGVRPTLFRAPSGAYDDEVVQTARALGWEVIQWSNDSLDWKGLSAQEISARVIKQATPGDIMLFHAGKPNTAAALDTVLTELTARGYRFVPVGELIYPAPYTIDHTGRQFAGG